jgi:hypothetical protein
MAMDDASFERAKINVAFVDAWFQAFAILPSLYLGWLRNLHQDARTEARKRSQ